MNRYYVGKESHRVMAVFRSGFTPTQESHGRFFKAVIGPFRTKFAADLMAAYGSGNPHFGSVTDAERIANFYRSKGYRTIAAIEKDAG